MVNSNDDFVQMMVDNSVWRRTSLKCPIAWLIDDACWSFGLGVREKSMQVNLGKTAPPRAYIDVRLPTLRVFMSMYSAGLCSARG